SACGKALGAVPESTVGYELRFNPAIQAAGNESQFVDYILARQPEPPLYFARMKRDNRQGPALLKKLPSPIQLQPDELVQKAQKENHLVLDCRIADAFMDAHLKGALLSSLDKSFNTVAGSYVKEDRTIYLIVEKHRVEEAVRDLIRIGLDKVAGFISPDALNQYFTQKGKST